MYRKTGFWRECHAQRNAVVLMFAGLVFSLAVMAQSGKAGNQYHNGLEGVQGASLPPAGVYLRWYNFYYNADTTKDARGKAQNVDLQVGAFATVPRIVWVTPKKR